MHEPTWNLLSILDDIRAHGYHSLIPRQCDIAASRNDQSIRKPALDLLKLFVIPVSQNPYLFLSFWFFFTCILFGTLHVDTNTRAAL